MVERNQDLLESKLRLEDEFYAKAYKAPVEVKAEYGSASTVSKLKYSVGTGILTSAFTCLGMVIIDHFNTYSPNFSSLELVDKGLIFLTAAISTAGVSAAVLLSYPTKNSSAGSLTEQ